MAERLPRAGDAQDPMAGRATSRSPLKSTAVITTELLDFDGRTLGVTTDVDDGGSVQVDVVDAENERLAASQPIGDTVTDGNVEWTLDGVSGGSKR